MKKRKKLLLGPVITIIILTIIIMVISSICAALGVQGEVTNINNQSLETSIVTVRSVFSEEGLKYFFSSPVETFKTFEPLVLLIISLMAVSIGKASGLFKAMFTPLKRLKPAVITFLTLFAGIISSFLGEYGFILVLPLSAVIYQYLGRNSMLGILTAFVGVSMGYGAGLVFNYDDYQLGLLTKAAATVDVDENYVFPEDQITSDIARVTRKVEASLADLEKVELDTVEAATKEIATDIDDLYATMEKEYDARQYVERNRKVLSEYITHSMRNNRQLLIELDHTAQSYTLNHNELGQTRTFQTEIEELFRRNELLEPKIEKKEVPYTEIQAFYKDLSNNATPQEIEKVLLELRTKFAVLSVDKQRIAEIILSDIQSGEFDYQDNKGFMDYILELYYYQHHIQLLFHRKN